MSASACARAAPRAWTRPWPCWSWSRCCTATRPPSPEASGSAWRSRGRWPRTPALLLLDEPLAALDVALKERVLPYLLRIRDEARVPLLYVTHQLGEARVLAQEALLLEQGRVRAVGPADSVLGGATRGVLGMEAEENILEGTLERPAERRPAAARGGGAGPLGARWARSWPRGRARPTRCSPRTSSCPWGR